MRAGGINLAALTCIQAANAIIPLMIVPLVLSRLGADAYAQLAIAEAASMPVLAFVLFSFEVDGVARVVGLSRERNPAELGEALSDIISARFALFVLGAALAVGIAGLIGGSLFVLLPLYLLVPLGQVFHSYWFYQGIERNIIPAIATVGARGLSFALVFALVHGPEDQALVPLLIGGPFLAAGLLSLSYARSALGLRIHWVGGARIWRALHGGKEIFIGNAAVTLYREMNVVLLSLAGVGGAGIAAYSLAEKTVKMIQACTRPLNQFFFPKILRAIAGCGAPTPAAARRVAGFTLYQVGVMLLILAAIPAGYALVAPHWAWLAQFAGTPGFVPMFVIMAPSTIFGLANFMFGSAALNYLGARRYLLGAILGTGLVSAAMCLALGMAVGALGGAICFLFSEILLFALIMARFLIGR